MRKLGNSIFSSKGFTLMELSISLIVIGAMAAGLLVTIRPILIQAKVTATEANMNHVIDILSAYALRNNRIPCPGDPDESVTAQPYGAEVGSGSDGAGLGSCPTTGVVEGIIPFRTLGLGREDAKDGWGNFLTYRVSPAFARDTSTDATLTEAHARCRTSEIWVQEDASGNAFSRDPAKAKFCCPNITNPDPDTDVVIKDETDKNVWPLSRDNSAGSYKATGEEVPVGTNFSLANDNVTAIAFVIVSHGANGIGAYNNSGGEIAGYGIEGDFEKENNDHADEEFRTAPLVFSETSNHFDDIVMWRTQDQLMAETGSGSCVYP